jgi:hypothetical protein
MRAPPILASSLAAVLAASSMCGCASLSAALTPEAVHRNATLAYVGLADWVAGDEARGDITPARVIADEAIRLKSWNALTVERAAWATQGPHVPGALDALADSLKPAGL